MICIYIALKLLQLPVSLLQFIVRDPNAFHSHKSVTQTQETKC
jgi:hypothetical protein